MSQEPKSLQQLMDTVPNLVEYFANDTRGPHDKENHAASPVPPVYTTWQEEQQAWRNGVLLFDQSHHMPETFVSGPDAERLLCDVGASNMKNFGPMKARQYFAMSNDGYFIGESIMQRLEDGTFELISGMHVQNWLQYNAEVGGYDVELIRDHNTADNRHKRTFYRYELEGPLAMQMFDDLCDGGAPELPFFRMAKVKIKGHDVLALRHSMAGHGGVELSGPAAEGPAMLDILLKAGEKYQMKRAGIITYFTVRSEVDWIGYPMPAIYTDPKLRAFREWLPANGWEGRSELAGSFVSDNIEDYYLTPWDMGYHNRINWDRDFIGKDALVAMKDKEHRVKKMLIWDPEDVTRVYRSQFEKDEIPFKHMGMPRATYGFTQYDTVYTKSGDVAGLSVCSIFTANEGRYTSAAVLKPEYAEAGQELEILWGEPNGGSRKKHVEKHRQTKIKATVASAPYSVLAMNKR